MNVLFLLTSSPDLVGVWESFKHWCWRFITCFFVENLCTSHQHPFKLIIFDPRFVRWSTDDIMSKWSTMKLFHVLKKKHETIMKLSLTRRDRWVSFSYVLGKPICPTKIREACSQQQILLQVTLAIPGEEWLTRRYLGSPWGCGGNEWFWCRGSISTALQGVGLKVPTYWLYRFDIPYHPFVLHVLILTCLVLTNDFKCT